MYIEQPISMGCPVSSRSYISRLPYHVDSPLAIKTHDKPEACRCSKIEVVVEGGVLV